MKALIIGGTGTISSVITARLANDPEWELYLFNRGIHPLPADLASRVNIIKGDISDEKQASELLKDMSFDCVAEFTGFTPDQVARDIRLFSGKTKQFMYISSCAAYCTPPSSPFMQEGMLLFNPYWQYARDKIDCENVLLDAFRKGDLPITIIRPAHTYSERFIPFCLESPKGSWPVIQRMLDGKQIIMPGDGSSLWTITYNDDFAKGFIGLMGNPHAIGEAVHITTDESLTWNQMAQAVADELNVEYKPYCVPTDVLTAIEPELSGGLNGDKRHSVVYDNAKLKRLVPGFHATTTWRVGVSRALKVILSHPEMRPADPAFDIWCDKLIEIYDCALLDAKAKCGRLF